MKYIIDDKWMKELRSFYNGNNMNKLLQKLKPVEIIASGYGEEFTGMRVDIPDKYKNQPIKIYIEEQT